MKFFKKYYVYISELIIGNIIFNLIYSIFKTITLVNIGAINEVFSKNLKNTFLETFIIYLIIYVIAVIIQIYYDKTVINKLNNKLNNTKERG